MGVRGGVCPHAHPFYHLFLPGLSSYGGTYTFKKHRDAAETPLDSGVKSHKVQEFHIHLSTGTPCNPKSFLASAIENPQ